MITIHGRFATYGVAWFDEEVPTSPDVDVLLLLNRPSVAHPYLSEPFLTLVNDLRRPQIDLFSALSRTTRYEVRRVDGHDGLQHHVIEEPRSYLGAFIEFYDRFAIAASISSVYRRELVAACDSGRLRLSTASCGGAPIIWHAYLTGRDRVMLRHSASQFRSMDTKERQSFIARANKWAHWQDMLAFKAAGLTYYDWGGVFSDEHQPEQSGINRFKRQFGGYLERNYDSRLPMTRRGHVVLALTSMVDRMALWTRSLKAPRAGGSKTMLFYSMASACMVSEA